MSTTEIDLTGDEQTLHHYAAVLEKNLVAYRACRSRDEKTWRNVFTKILVYIFASLITLVHQAKFILDSINELLC